MSPARGLVSAGLVLLIAGLFAWPRLVTWLEPGEQGEALAFRFEEKSQKLGIDFVHEQSPADPRIDHVAQITTGFAGASVSVTDVNADGWPDLYLTTSRFGAKNRLYLNREGHFEDIAESVGLAELNTRDQGVSCGSAWADYDGDGREDMLLLRYGRLALYRNEGAAFRNVTEEAGLGAEWLSAADASWLDFDRDGCLDLYVGTYLPAGIDLWNVGRTDFWWDGVSRSRNGGTNLLYRSRCDGRFEEVAARVGADDKGWTIGVATADLDGDGYTDIYVANDVGRDALLLNRGGARFEDAFGEGGSLRDTRKGMNASFGDFRNSGRLGAYVSNMTKPGYIVEGNMLWENLGGGRFKDIGWDVGAADGGWGWGAQFGDLDNSGRMDIFTVNGMLSADPQRDYWYEMSSMTRGGAYTMRDLANWPPLEGKSLSGYERSRVFVQDGGGRFRDVAGIAGVTDLYDGRGVALADLNRDGALDAVVANQRGPLLVYMNRVSPRRHWIQFRLSSHANSPAIGARVELHWNGQRQLQEVGGKGGFAGHSDTVLHFGLGEAPRLERADVRWPSGRTQRLDGLEIDRIYELREPGP